MPRKSRIDVLVAHMILCPLRKMRLDSYLKTTRLIPRRSSANDLCREGKVEVNGQPAKAGRTVRPGDRIRYRLPGKEVLVEITEVPLRKNVSKVDARSYYSIIKEKRFDIWGREIVTSRSRSTAADDPT